LRVDVPVERGGSADDRVGIVLVLAKELDHRLEIVAEPRQRQTVRRGRGDRPAGVEADAAAAGPRTPPRAPRPAHARSAVRDRRVTGTAVGASTPTMSPVEQVEIRLVNGDALTVEGSLEEVEKRLSDAARSGQSRLAWFGEEGRSGPIGVNPDHVVTLRAREEPDPT
jgi:hypothetical protein